MKLRALLPYALLLLLALAACAPPPELRNDALLADTSLLTGGTCEAPCWRGITPGETTWREAQIIVEDDPQLTNDEEITSEESAARLLRFNAEDGPECCRIYTIDGETVSDILLLLAPEMRFEQVIEQYGEPSYVLIGDEGADITPDQAVLSMLYPDVPMIVYVFAEGTENGQVTANSEIIGSVYMTDENMDLVISSRNLYGYTGYQSVADIVGGEFVVTPAPTSEANASDDN